MSERELSPSRIHSRNLEISCSERKVEKPLGTPEVEESFELELEPSMASLVKTITQPNSSSLFNFPDSNRSNDS